MDIPARLIEIVEAAARKHSNDIDEALKEAESEARTDSEFDNWINLLVRSAIRDLIYDFRHRVNVKLKTDSKYYGPGAKVKPGSSSGVADVCESIFAYHIAGTTLGRLRREQLDDLEKKEREMSKGHLFNAELLKWIKSRLPEGKTVEEAINEKVLRSNFVRIQKAVAKAA